MTSFTRFFSSIKSVYNNINPSTLTGAIDVIVVKQEDETLRCTPFHVRFGKLGVLQNHQNKVYININGIPVDDLYMQLGEAGEAVFLEENTVVEPSDGNTRLDLDCSPQIIITKQVDTDKVHEIDPSVLPYVYEQAAIPSVEVDVVQLITPVSNPSRRRVKRRAMNRTGQTTGHQSSDDEDAKEGQRSASPTSRRSRARKRDIPTVPVEKTSTCISSDEQVNASFTALRRRSASENDLTCFQLDDEEQSQPPTPFADAHSRLNSIDSRQKSFLPLSGVSITKSHPIDDNEESYSSSQEDSQHDLQLPLKTTRTLSNPIPIELPIKNDPLDTVEESNSLIRELLSQSAPISILTDSSNPIPIRINQSNDSATSYYLNEDFSPSSSLPSPASPRPTSPKSDTEYELDKSAQQSAITNQTSLGWRWRWGELPEQRRRVFRYLWPSSSSSTVVAKNSAHTDGIYLDDITNNKCDDRSRYLPQMDYDQNQHRINKDDDQESGKGNSVPQSPVREQEAAGFLGDVQLSLCGHLQKPSDITDDIFNAHLISCETFSTNLSIISDPNLVVRIAGKFYDWNVASSLIASANIYHKQLPAEVIEQLLEKHLTTNKARSTTSGSWWPFSGRKSEMTNESLKSTTTEALAWAVKSEVVSTIPSGHDLLRKHSNDSEIEDNEVRKLTDKMEQQQQQTNATHTLKKTLLLTSDQLARLNLKPGMNPIEFSVTTALQGTTMVGANIFYFDHQTKFVISDIDGTITKSDVFGHIFPFVGKDWSHDGIAGFFKGIQQNGYQFIYLSARAIGQSRITRNFLRNVKQCGYGLPDGPLFISPDTLVAALYREVIAKKPEDFKIECLKNIASLFPGTNPFYAGFGNRINDQWAYTAVGIPVTRIFTINSRGEVVRQTMPQALSTSYKNLHEVVDQVFPSTDSFSASEAYSSFTFWRSELTTTNLFEDEMCQDLQDIAKRQKSKGKGAISPTSALVPKSGGDKLLPIGQATQTTVKKT